MIKKLKIKIKNQNIEGQTLTIIKYWIERQNWKEKSNSQNNIEQKKKQRIPICNERNDNG
jgi:hypothetical protein